MWWKMVADRGEGNKKSNGEETAGSDPIRRRGAGGVVGGVVGVRGRVENSK